MPLFSGKNSVIFSIKNQTFWTSFFVQAFHSLLQPLSSFSNGQLELVDLTQFLLLREVCHHGGVGNFLSHHTTNHTMSAVLTFSEWPKAWSFKYKKKKNKLYYCAHLGSVWFLHNKIPHQFFPTNIFHIHQRPLSRSIISFEVSKCWFF